MSLPRNDDSDQDKFNYADEKPIDHQDLTEDKSKLAHKRWVRKQLENRLERKRLLAEIEDLEDDFDWSELER